MGAVQLTDSSVRDRAAQSALDKSRAVAAAATATQTAADAAVSARDRRLEQSTLDRERSRAVATAQTQAADLASAKAAADTALLDSSAAGAPRLGVAAGTTKAVHWAPLVAAASAMETSMGTGIVSSGHADWTPLVAADPAMGASACSAGHESPDRAVLASQMLAAADNDGRMVMTDIERLEFEQAEFEQTEIEQEAFERDLARAKAADGLRAVDDDSWLETQEIEDAALERDLDQTVADEEIHRLEMLGIAHEDPMQAFVLTAPAARAHGHVPASANTGSASVDAREQRDVAFVVSLQHSHVFFPAELSGPVSASAYTSSAPVDARERRVCSVRLPPFDESIQHGALAPWQPGDPSLRHRR